MDLDQWELDREQGAGWAVKAGEWDRDEWADLQWDPAVTVCARIAEKPFHINKASHVHRLNVQSVAEQ